MRKTIIEITFNKQMNDYLMLDWAGISEGFHQRIVKFSEITKYVTNISLKSLFFFFTHFTKSTFNHCNNKTLSSWQPTGHRFVPWLIHSTCWKLGSKQGFLKERTGCSMDFATECLSCLRSTQRSISMSSSSPRSIPTYKLKFQPQLMARGSEVEATRNFLGAGMSLGSIQAWVPSLREYFPFLKLGSSLRWQRRCSVKIRQPCSDKYPTVWGYVKELPSAPLVHPSNQRCGEPVECVCALFELSKPPEMKWWRSVRVCAAGVCLPSPVRLLHKSQPPNSSTENERREREREGRREREKDAFNAIGCLHSSLRWNIT